MTRLAVRRPDPTSETRTVFFDGVPVFFGTPEQVRKYLANDDLMPDADRVVPDGEDEYR